MNLLQLFLWIHYLFMTKLFLQVQLHNCAYKSVDKKVIDYPGDNQALMNNLDPAKSNNSKECMVHHYWFFSHGFKDLDYVCNGCNDLLMLCVNISNIAIIAVKGVGYCCVIYDNSKSDTINLSENSVLNDCSYK